MSVGGRIIEKKRLMTPTDAPRLVTQYWVMDRHGDETCVWAEPQDDEPALGEEIWWQSMVIYWANDTKQLAKVGYSFQPHAEAA